MTLAVLRRDDDERDRDIWARTGVLVNELAAPALVLKPAGRLIVRLPAGGSLKAIADEDRPASRAGHHDQ